MNEQQSDRHYLLRALMERYRNMAVIQLRKQKQYIVQEAKELHQALNNLIHEQHDHISEIERVEKQISNNRKLKKNLKQSLQTFSFMLTGDYSLELDQQIEASKQELKQLKMQVSSLNRQLSIPMQKDIQICEELEKQRFDLEKQIQTIKAKNQEKYFHLQKVVQDNNKKAQTIHALTKKIKTLVSKINNSSHGDFIHNKDNTAVYEKLLIKREKMQMIVEGANRKGVQQYKQIKQQNRSIGNHDQEILKLQTQLNEEISAKENQLKQWREKKRQSTQTIKKRMKSMGVERVSERLKTHGQQSDYSTNFLIERERQASRIREQSRREGITGQQYNPLISSVSYINSSEKEENFFPTIHKVLGKKKLLVEEEYDLGEIVYE